MYIPRPYQNDARDSIFLYYANGGTGNPIIAMPTATGKSLVIAEFCKMVLQAWPRQRLICLTHVKELIEQNAEKIKAQWPAAPLGIFSAGLKKRDTHFPIIYGGVGSAVNCIEKFGHRDILLVDEAHLISPKDGTNYQKVIHGLRKVNPQLKVIGFTATPYRTGQGLLTEGPDRIFTDICYDLTTFEAFNKLISDGYLVAPVPKHTKTELDVTGIKTVAGDFNQNDLQTAVDVESVTYAALKEAVEEGFDRQSWIAFASGIEHAEHIALTLQSMGIDAATVHSRLPSELADERIKRFRNGKIHCLVCYGKLTTGFDHPPIDFIIMLRPTMSTTLWVQMLGRGMRPYPRKENCLVLDFARNTLRLGPINDPVLPRRRVKGDVPGVAPVRICEVCGVYNHARAVVCCACGHPFPKVEKLIASAGTEELVRREVDPIIATFEVHRIFYNRVQKQDRPPMIRVQYICGLVMFSEYVCLEHPGYAQKKARMWWREHMGVMVTPPTTDEALKHIAMLRVPKRITVHTNKKYPEVLTCEY